MALSVFFQLTEDDLTEGKRDEAERQKNGVAVPGESRSPAVTRFCFF
jgi:hypothetical protein